MIDAICSAALVIVACQFTLVLAVVAVFAYAKGVTHVRLKRLQRVRATADHLIDEIDSDGVDQVTIDGVLIDLRDALGRR